MYRIEGEDKLREVFGRWPSFHDANILEWRRETTSSDVAIILVIHLFRMTPEIDERGYYRLEKHTKATLRFDGCAGIQLSESNTGIIFSLKITEAENAGGHKLEVVIDSSYGLGGSFMCDRIEVLEVQSFLPPVKQSPPNQSPEPVPAAGTPPAGQESRHA